MHHHTTHRGRSHTQKQNICKQKITAAERQKRLIKKKLFKLFSSWKTLHPICSKNAVKSNSAPTGAEFRMKPKSIYQHSLMLIKKSPATQWEYRRLRV